MKAALKVGALMGLGALLGIVGFAMLAPVGTSACLEAIEHGEAIMNLSGETLTVFSTYPVTGAEVEQDTAAIRAINARMEPEIEKWNEAKARCRE